MTDNSELIERLHHAYEYWGLGSKGPLIIKEAADALASQAARIAELEAELLRSAHFVARVSELERQLAELRKEGVRVVRPFADWTPFGEVDDGELLGSDDIMIDEFGAHYKPPTLGNLRAARTLRDKLEGGKL